jgi:DNA-binding CsgD family transcriptional regulator
MTIKEMRIMEIKKALLKHKSVKEAAKSLGITPETINNYRKKERDG